MNRLIEFFAKQTLFVNLLTAFIFLTGAYSVWKIKRETFPNVQFDIVTITTAFPGAAPESVERLITNPLEQDLKEVDGIKKMRSVSADSQSVIVLWIDPNHGDSKEVESDLQDVVDKFTDIPEDAKSPVVTMLESKNTPIVEISIAGDVDEGTLRKAAKLLERKIEAVPSVAKTQFNGLRDYEIRVEADPKKLQAYQISIQDVINALRTRNVTIPGGTIDARTPSDMDVTIRTIGEYENTAEIERTVVRSNALAEPILIKNLATVSMQFERGRYATRTDGKPSMTLTVLKKDRSDAISLVEDLRKVVEDARPSLDPKLKIDFVNDFSRIVKRRLSVLTGNLWIGLGIIVIVLGMLLPLRVALLVGLGIPLSFLGTIAYFYGTGVSLNLISMMGLIIVVGMLVDDAVVVIETCQKRTENGEDPRTAAIEGTKSVWLPVASSVLTTVVAFLPLMFMSGIFGKFVMNIPLGVIVALFVSLGEAYFILPNHFAGIMPAKGTGKPLRGFLSPLWERLFENPYGKIVAFVVKHRWLALLSLLLFVIGTGLVAKKHASFVLFPKGGIDIFMINLEAEVGTPLDRMAELSRPAEDIALRLPETEVENVITRVGRQMQDENRSKSGTNVSQVVVFLTPETKRTRTAFDIIDELRTSVGKPPGITSISFEMLAGGPPVGKPVSIGVRSNEYEQILPLVAEVKAELGKISGVTDISDNYLLGKKELQVFVREDEATAAGLSVRDVGTSVRAAFEGIVATSIRKLEEEIDIRVMFPAADRGRRDALDDLMIPNMRGQLIPVSRITTRGNAQGLATFEHEANQREVRVSAEVDEKETSSLEVNRIMKTITDKLASKHPDVSFAFGGEDEDTKESMQTLVTAFIFAFVGILFLLILTFGNVVQPFLVAVTIPLGVIAVIWTFVLHNRPLSFLAMMGTIALAGVIVNNAILLIDTVNSFRKSGMDRFESVIAAARDRIRPIFLTSFTTVAGMLPTAYGIGGLDPFVVPMALALGWGLALGSVLTVIYFPAIIVAADDVIYAFRAGVRRIFFRTPKPQSSR